MYRKHAAPGLVAVAMMTALPASASTLVLSDFGIYAAQGPVVIGGGAEITGAVGSGGALTVGSNAKIDGDVVADGNVTLNGGTVSGNVSTGGTFNGGSNSSFQNVTANGNATFNGGTTVNGAVNTGGTFNGGSNSSFRDVTASGTATFNGGTTVNGAIAAGGNVSVGSNSNLSGATVTTGGNFTQNGGGSAPAATATGVAATPAPASYAADTLDGVILPAGVTPTSPVGNNRTGGSNQTLTLAPGGYEVLNYGGGFNLSLTAGDYYFSSFTLGSNSRLFYDLTLGGINIFVDGNVNIGGGSEWTLTGGTAADILWEVGGDFTVGRNAEMFGTIYTSGTTTIEDDIAIGGGAKITGALYSTGGINIGSNLKFTHMQHSSFGQPPAVDSLAPIPLPAAGWLLLGGLGALAAMRRRKTAA